ncbi:NAD(P)/FAD-dependent oxidoreductase [Cellulomonas timonensis]|uniref:NAD(P)/FAD-dependent oxidoreductase n=1 Tax=Cellulomonas timonensis TaxID=1689271 RepID=UPI00082EF83C|nr:FAD-dependent oxidoreductase [Cellulomonas timonensis]
MSHTTDVAIVGAGMFGSAAARHLTDAGVDVTVIGPSGPDDASTRPEHAFGAHHDEARIVRRLGWDAVWGSLDARSQERFASIEERSGLPFFEDCGSLVLMARSISHRTEKILAQCAADGIAVERLDEDDLARRFPALGAVPIAGGVEGLYENRGAGYLNPRLLVRAQLALAAGGGARHVRAAVTDVRPAGSGGWVLDVRGDGVDETVNAQRLLVATGAFTNVAGVLPGGRRLALHAFTEPNLLYELGEEQLGALRTLPTVVTVDPEDVGEANLSLYLLPPVRYPDGRWYMRIGPGMQPVVDELTRLGDMVEWYAAQTLTPRQEIFLSEMMQMLVPDLKPPSVRSACCIIEKTPSRYPYIGHVDDETLTVAVGGNGHGARGSDEIGRLAATVVLGQPWDGAVPADTFRPRIASDQMGGDPKCSRRSAVPARSRCSTVSTTGSTHNWARRTPMGRSSRAASGRSSRSAAR